jgi:hypothetical protein
MFNRPPGHERSVRRWRIQLVTGAAWLIASVPLTLATTADDKWLIGPLLLTSPVMTLAGAYADRRKSQRSKSASDREQ